MVYHQNRPPADLYQQWVCHSKHILLQATGAPATVHFVQPVGPVNYVTVDWAGGTLTARFNGLSPLRPKDQVQVTLDRAGLLFFDRQSEQLI